jgi:hypothetical protein
MCLRPGLQRLPERIASTEGLGLAAEGRVFKECRKRGRSSTRLPCLKRAGFVWKRTQAANAGKVRPSAKRDGRTDWRLTQSKDGAANHRSHRTAGRRGNMLEGGTGIGVRGTRGLTFEVTPTVEAGAVSRATENVHRTC